MLGHSGKKYQELCLLHYSLPFPTLLSMSASSRLSLWPARPSPQHCSLESIPSCLWPLLSLNKERILSQQQAQTLTVLRGRPTHTTCGRARKHTHTQKTLSSSSFLSSAHISCKLQSSWPYNKAAHCTEESMVKGGEVTALSQLAVCD